jgi:hypothetical protein
VRLSGIRIYVTNNFITWNSNSQNTSSYHDIHSAHFSTEGSAPVRAGNIRAIRPSEHSSSDRYLRKEEKSFTNCSRYKLDTIGGLFLEIQKLVLFIGPSVALFSPNGTCEVKINKIFELYILLPIV